MLLAARRTYAMIPRIPRWVLQTSALFWGTVLITSGLPADTPQHPLAQSLETLFNQKSWPLAKWNPGYLNLCVKPGSSYTYRTNEQKRLHDNLESFRASDPLASHLYNEMVKAGTSVCIEKDNQGTVGALHLGYNTVFLHAGLTKEQSHVVMAHEFRHREQNNNGYHVHSQYSFEDNLRIIFAKEADGEATAALDGEATAALYVWSMRLKGREEYWHATRSLRGYADIQQAFDNKLSAGASALEAAQAAFSQWYAGFNRLNQYHQNAQLDWAGYTLATFKQPKEIKILENNFFNGLSRLPDGSDYGAHETPEPYLTPQQAFDKSSLFLAPQ